MCYRRKNGNKLLDKKKSLHGNLSYDFSLYSFKTSESDIFTQTGPAKIMYDIKFDKKSYVMFTFSTEFEVI